MAGFEKNSKKGAVGGIVPASYVIPSEEIETLGDIALDYMREKSAALRPIAWCLWNTQPREFIEWRPAFRGRLAVRLELDRAIRRGEVSALVIDHPRDLARSWRGSLDLIRSWQRTGKLRELFSSTRGEWLIRGGEFVRGGRAIGDGAAPPERPTLLETLELVAEWEDEIIGQRVRTGMALSKSCRRPGRPKADIDVAQIKSRVAAGESTRGIVRAIQREVSSASSSTIRRRVREMRASAT